MIDARSRAPLPLLLGLLLFCLFSMALFDQPLTLYFHQLDTGAWHKAWKAITKAGQSEWYLVGGIGIFVLFWKRNRALSKKGLFLFTTVAVSGLTANLFKVIFSRARPKLLLKEDIYGFGFFEGLFEHAWQSFPSGHSTTALSAALSLSLLMPRFRPLFIVAGLVIASSRVVLCQHYLSDIVAGSALGVVTVVLLYPHFFPPETGDKPRLSTLSTDA